MAKKQKPHAVLSDYALSLPGAYVDYPWGEMVAKVGKKVFVFLGKQTKDGFGFSAKLPQSSEAALLYPFCEPTGYGLGKAGWVSAKFDDGDNIPVPLLLAWIEESYRAIAGKTLVKELDARGNGEPAPKKKAATKKKKVAKKKKKKKV